MSLLTLSRLLSLAGTAVLMYLTDLSPLYDSLLISLGMTHYLLSLAYSSRQIRGVAERPRTWIPALLLGGATLAISLDPRPDEYKLFYFFAIHHVCNEVYLLHASRDPAERRRLFPVVAASSLFHVLVYIGLATGGLPRQPSSGLLLPFLISSAVLYAASLAHHAARSGDRARLLDGGVECVAGTGLAAAASLHLIDVRFIDVVFYHFIFWAIWPLRHMVVPKLNRAPLGRYLAANAALMLVFVLMSPVAPHGLHFSMESFFALFYVWSYIHIGSAFALSAAHPRWITRWFAPPVAVPAPA